MRSIARVFGPTLLIAAAGCGEMPTLQVDVDAAAGSTSYPGTCPYVGANALMCGGREGALTGDLADACVSTDWIGYLVNGSTACPAARPTSRGTWAVSKLFPARHLNRRPQLDSFCLYHWDSPGGSAPVTSVLPNTSRMRLQRDCDVVAPQLVPEKDSAAILESSYAQLMDLPDFASTAKFPTATRVRVAIVDDSPTNTTSQLPSAGGQGHGFLMGSLAHQNSCIRVNGVPKVCGAKIFSYQGLPRGDHGAAYGRPSEVAAAMEAAVSDWVMSGKTDKLIINLSLGWDETYSGHYGPKIRTTVLSAWEVAQWAACEGAIIVAAGGNRSQVGRADGPMFPAGWELDQRQCPQLHIYSPIVHAVGGVDARDNPLMKARPGATPRLVAPAAFVTAKRLDAQQTQAELATGTSVAAAGVSGVAALVWAMDPTQTADEVIQAIYRSGVGTGRPADFDLLGTQFQVRVDACAAANQVCSSAACPLACATRPYPSDDRPSFGRVIDTELPGVLTRPPSIATLTPLQVVPSRREINASPFAGPQPGGDPCPVCGFNANSVVGQLDLPADTTLVDVVLRTEPAMAGVDPDLGGLQIELDDTSAPFSVDLTGYVDPAVTDSAMIEVTTETDGELVVRAAELFFNP